MTKIALRTHIPHGVVFLYDPSMIVDIPEDTGRGALLCTENCISIWTIQEDEGGVSLVFSDEVADAREHVLFNGILQTSGKRLAFNDSGANCLLEIRVQDDQTKMRVFSDRTNYPTSVICLVGEIFGS